jgi:hypothetical protein
MKLSENFVEVLKNFASINSGLVVKPGQVLRTISSNKTILAEAHVDEVFESEFGIYDLNTTLALLSLNSKSAPEVQITEDSLVYLGLNGRGRTKQRFTDVKLILSPPNKTINVGKFEVKFDLTEEIYDWIFNVSSILKCPNIVVQSDGDTLSLNAIDVKGELVDSADVKLEGEFTVKSFKAVFKIDNIKVLPGAYTVEIASAGVSKFTHKTKKLTYWISIEAASSSFEK